MVIFTTKRAIVTATSIAIVVILSINLLIYHSTSPKGPHWNNDNPEDYPPYDPPQYGLKLVRPKIRKYTSASIEELLVSARHKMRDDDLYVLLQNCLPNTLDTTVEWLNMDNNDPRTFVITGDIPAMWIRDSSNQVAPYIKYTNEDQSLKNLVFGVIQVQAAYLYYDPYANAFLKPWYAPYKEERQSNYGDEVIPVYDHNIVWESKYELDSISHFIQLTNDYIAATKDTARIFHSSDWVRAIPRIFRVLQDQMEDSWSFPELKLKKHTNMTTEGEPEPVSLKDGYRFRRMTNRPTETLGEYGLGGISKKCGLIRSAFRPSDDATIFPYLIPANAHLSVQLLKLHDNIQQFMNDPSNDINTIDLNMTQVSMMAKDIGEGVREAVFEHGVIHHPVFGKVFAYEVDCYGSHLIMDDANTPSLLSLPLLGFMNKTDAIYQNTRKLILSDSNPWYFNGTFASGIGGPHTGRNMIWPMSILTQIRTSTSETEVRLLIDILKRMALHTGHLMCESFNANSPVKFTRPWFSWANGLAGATILETIDAFPHLG